MIFTINTKLNIMTYTIVYYFSIKMMKIKSIKRVSFQNKKIIVILFIVVIK